MSDSHSTVRVGTRGSLLARTQTEWVLDRLRAQHPAVRFEAVIIRTSGELRTQEGPARFAGKGFFPRRSRTRSWLALSIWPCDSLKDLPIELAGGSGPGCGSRAGRSPRDALEGVLRTSAGCRKCRAHWHQQPPPRDATAPGLARVRRRQSAGQSGHPAPEGARPGGRLRRPGGGGPAPAATPAGDLRLLHPGADAAAPAQGAGPGDPCR